MIASGYPSQDRTPGRIWRLLIAVVGILVPIGFIWSNSAAQLAAYLLVVSAAVLPSVFWIRRGAQGIPILPIVSLAYIPYFAWPILNNSDIALDYTTWEIMRAGLTVFFFLVTAAVSWLLVMPEVSTLRRRVARHATLFGRVFPARGREIRQWLRSPTSGIAGLWFLSPSHHASAIQKCGGRDRVRRPKFPSRTRGVAA